MGMLEPVGEVTGGLVGTAVAAVGGLGNGGNSSPRHAVATTAIRTAAPMARSVVKPR